MIVSAHDLIVVGAGPAGGNAALAAATAGLDVVLIDEQMSAGGQVWRKPLRKAASSPEKTVGSKKRAPGDALRSELALSNVQCAFGQRVWSLGAGLQGRYARARWRSCLHRAQADYRNWRA
jgi:glycine/D-amino acid oxidase-like deaminating enzyme